MHLSESGCIAKKCWLEIADHFPFVKLSEFVIMPNHVHGIISIIKNPVNDDPRIDIDYPHNAETRHALSLPVQPPVPIQPPIPVQPPVPVKLSSPGQKRFQNQGKNTVSSIIGGYKSATTRNIRKMSLNFNGRDDSGTTLFVKTMNLNLSGNILSKIPPNGQMMIFFGDK